MNKADALSSLERYDEAIATYKETFTFEEPNADMFYFIGECYENNLQYDEALEYFKKATQLDSMHSDAWAGMAYVFNE